jgi:hypothetical protein
MKKRRYEDREMRDRRRKQVLQRIQEEEWKEQWQSWAADEEAFSGDQMDYGEDRDGG